MDLISVCSVSLVNPTSVHEPSLVDSAAKKSSKETAGAVFGFLRWPRITCFYFCFVLLLEQPLLAWSRDNFSLRCSFFFSFSHCGISLFVLAFESRGLLLWLQVRVWVDPICFEIWVCRPESPNLMRLYWLIVVIICQVSTSRSVCPNLVWLIIDLIKKSGLLSQILLLQTAARGRSFAICLLTVVVNNKY